MERWESGARDRECALGAADHDFGGFDEGEGGVAGFQGEFAGGVGGDDGGEALSEG